MALGAGLWGWKTMMIICIALRVFSSLPRHLATRQKRSQDIFPLIGGTSSSNLVEEVLSVDNRLLFFRYGHSPFFSPFSFVRPTQIFGIFKKKKNRKRSFQTFFMSHSSFGGGSSFPRCLNYQLFRHIDFGLSSCCFLAPQLWCFGTRPPIPRLLILFF